VADRGASLAETQGFTFSRVHIRPKSGAVYVLEKTRDLTISSAVVPLETTTFVSVNDTATSGVRIVGTDLKAIAHPVSLPAGAKPAAVTVEEPVRK
jgi:hypothetical protein